MSGRLQELTPGTQKSRGWPGQNIGALTLRRSGLWSTWPRHPTLRSFERWHGNPVVTPPEDFFISPPGNKPLKSDRPYPATQ